MFAKLIKFTIFVLLILDSVYFASSLSDDASVDGRPDYMRGIGNYVSTCDLPPLSDDMQFFFKSLFIPVPNPRTPGYAFDRQSQRSDLCKFYLGEYDEGRKGGTSILVASKSQPLNPKVILFLHGSSGDTAVIKPFVSEIIRQGMAFITFSRFKLTYVDCAGVSTQSIKSSWNNQTEIPLNVQVMMVYGVCKELIKLGTQEIYLVGHSLGGTLTLECSKEFNAQHFRHIRVGDNTGGVVSYTPISAMPVFMEPITSVEKVNIIHGIYDTVCCYNIMKFYYDIILSRQANVSISYERSGHIPWFIEMTWRISFLQLGTELWKNKLIPRSWLRASTNFVKNIGYLVFGIRSFITEHRPNADNFNNACVVLENDGFKPVVTGRGGNIFAGERRDMDGLPDYIRGMVRKGVWAREIPAPAKEGRSSIARIVDLIARSAAPVL